MGIYANYCLNRNNPGIEKNKRLSMDRMCMLSIRNVCANRAYIGNNKIMFHECSDPLAC